MRNPIDTVAELLFDAGAYSRQCERIAELESKVADLQRRLEECQVALKAAVEAQQFYYGMVAGVGKR